MKVKRERETKIKWNKVKVKKEIERETKREILINNVWLPKSQIEIKEDEIEIPEWLWNQKGGCKIIKTNINSINKELIITLNSDGSINSITCYRDGIIVNDTKLEDGVTVTVVEGLLPLSKSPEKGEKMKLEERNQMFIDSIHHWIVDALEKLEEGHKLRRHSNTWSNGHENKINGDYCPFCIKFLKKEGHCGNCFLTRGNGACCNEFNMWLEWRDLESALNMVEHLWKTGISR